MSAAASAWRSRCTPSVERWCFARHTISFKSDASACGCRTGSPPGALAVTHAELGDGRFLFKLDIVHPRLGRLICQTAAFREAYP